MVKKKVKRGTAAGNCSDPGNTGTTDTSQEETTLSSPLAVNGTGLEVPSAIKTEDKSTSTGGMNVEVAFESKSEDKNTSAVGLDDENVVPLTKNGEAATEGEKTEKGAIQGENNDGATDEQIAKEEEADEPIVYEKEDDESITKEEEDDDEQKVTEEEEAGEEEDEEAQEEGEDFQEELMETAEEVAGEEKVTEEVNVEKVPQIAKAEETVGANPGKTVKKLSTQSRLRKVVPKLEKNPGTSSKKKVETTAVGRSGTAGKQKVDTTAKKAPKASGKKIVAVAEKDKPEASSKEKVASTAKDKPGESRKRKSSERVECRGLIFMCNSKTKKDCYRYKVLGLPASKKDLVQKVYKGMRLFLFDIDLRVMYGIYKAAGPGGYNIQPKAFDSAFPSQVRFTVLKDCLPLAEEKFKKVIRDNYYAKKKFNCQLNLEQVKNLCKLFSASSQSSEFKQPKAIAAETRHGKDRGRVRQSRVDEVRLGRSRIRRSRLAEETLDPMLDEERLSRGRTRRRVLDQESLDRGRFRREGLEEEMLDHVRVRRPRRDEESWEPRYHARPVAFEADRYASALPSTHLAYDSYGRNAEAALYIREPVVEHRDRIPALEHRDRIPALEHRDHRILDLDVRHGDEVGIRDPFTSYRVYDPPPRVPPVATTYVPLTSLASEYRRLEESPRYEYSSLRPLYRY